MLQAGESSAAVARLRSSGGCRSSDRSLQGHRAPRVACATRLPLLGYGTELCAEVRHPIIVVGLAPMRGKTLAGQFGINRLALRADGLDERPDPLRWRGNQAAADHAHLGEAARPRRQQAGALLRDRGPGRGRSAGDRHRHRARDRRGDPRGGRGRLRLRGRDHVHPPGGAAGPRPRGALGRGVPRRLVLRHVPRRQPAARRHHAAWSTPFARTAQMP